MSKGTVEGSQGYSVAELIPPQPFVQDEIILAGSDRKGLFLPKFKRIVPNSGGNYKWGLYKESMRRFGSIMSEKLYRSWSVENFVTHHPRRNLKLLDLWHNKMKTTLNNLNPENDINVLIFSKLFSKWVVGIFFVQSQISHRSRVCTQSSGFRAPEMFKICQEEKQNSFSLPQCIFITFPSLLTFFQKYIQT